MSPIWSVQPFKAIYTTLFLLSVPPHLVLLLAQYLVKSLRPLPKWSLKNSINATIMQWFFKYTTATRSQRTFYADPATAKERHVHIPAPDDDLFSGVLAASALVKPGPVDAVWIPSPPPPATELHNSKVVLHFPGGAFVIAFGHNTAGIDVANTMTKHMKADRTIWAQYRLSGTPGAQFPGSIQDALTFYNYLVSLGVQSKNIVLSGDSAGGNVVIGMLRHLEDAKSRAGERLPLPGGAILFSPWVHVTPAAGLDYDQCAHSRSDILISSIVQWGADAYIPNNREFSEDERAYISPLHHPFKTSVPLFFHAGNVEAFHDTVKNFADEMAQLNGSKVRFHSSTLAPHDLLLVHANFGMTEELGAVVESARDFFAQQANTANL